MKCSFAQFEAKYLGYIIDKDGNHTDPSKISTIKEYPVLTNVTEVHAFLRLVSYYRRFVKGFSSIASPLFKLLKDAVFEWYQDQQEAFEALKIMLMTSPILAQPDWEKPFILQTDASAMGLGAILTQKDDQGHDTVICYASKGNSATERNYDAYKLECLAVVWAVEQYRYYLEGRPFTVQTDNAAVSWLNNKKEPKGQITHWIIRLQEYDIKYTHRPGKQNSNVDPISRIPRPSPHPTDFDDEL